MAAFTALTDLQNPKNLKELGSAVKFTKGDTTSTKEFVLRLRLVELTGKGFEYLCSAVGWLMNASMKDGKPLCSFYVAEIICKELSINIPNGIWGDGSVRRAREHDVFQSHSDEVIPSTPEKGARPSADPMTEYLIGNMIHAFRLFTPELISQFTASLGKISLPVSPQIEPAKIKTDSSTKSPTAQILALEETKAHLVEQERNLKSAMQEVERKTADLEKREKSLKNQVDQLRERQVTTQVLQAPEIGKPWIVDGLTIDHTVLKIIEAAVNYEHKPNELPLATMSPEELHKECFVLRGWYAENKRKAAENPKDKIDLKQVFKSTNLPELCECLNNCIFELLSQSVAAMASHRTSTGHTQGGAVVQIREKFIKDGERIGKWITFVNEFANATTDAEKKAIVAKIMLI